MTRFFKVLLTVIGVEIIGMAYLMYERGREPRLPEVDWSLFEEATAADIRKLEEGLLNAKGGRISRDPEKWFNLAETYRAFGLFPQADHCYRQLQKLAPNDPTYLYHWGIVLDRLGQTTEASNRYQEVIQLGGLPRGPMPPELAISYCWLAIAQDRLREEQIEPAMEALRKALELPKARWLLARLLIRSGQAEQAISLLDPVLRKNPDVLELNEMRSYAEEELGHTGEAMKFQELALRSTKNLERNEPTFGDVEKRRNAIGGLALFYQSVAAEKKGQLEEAATLARKSLQASLLEGRAIQLSKIEMMLGHHQKAIEVMRDIIEYDGAAGKTLNAIGSVSILMHDQQQALEAFESACRIQPTSGIYQKLAYLARVRKDRAEEQRCSALEQYYMGRTAFEKNSLATAWKHLETATQSLPDKAPIWFYLAEARRAQGDSAGALEGYQRCLQLDPLHGRARAALERLRR